jgi:Flp pilus assembly protein TadG
MILFMFAMVEIGGLMMIKNAATHASREGARLAITPTASSEDVRSRVIEAMQNYTTAPVVVTISPSDLSSANQGGMVTVRVEADPAATGWLSGAIPLPISSVAGETTMRRESTN